MAWYSMYGTGATIHGIEPQSDGRVEFTSWISVLWIPIVPLSSWSAFYAGQGAPDLLSDESYSFLDLKRIPHRWWRNLLTFAWSVAVAAGAVVPAAFMIWLMRGRAATDVEMALVCASVVWAVGLILWSEHLRRRKLDSVRLPAPPPPVAEDLAEDNALDSPNLQRQLSEGESPAEREQRERKRLRIIMSLWAVGGGLVFVFFLGAPYLGYLFVGTGILALLGVNVFWGGPLDRRLDRGGDL